MSDGKTTVTSAESLLAATKDNSVREIFVGGAIDGAPTIRLGPGQSLHGDDEDASISFGADSDGVQLTSDNLVENLELHVQPEKRAIFNDISVAGLGLIHLANLVTIGRVQLLARDNVRSGHVLVEGLDIVAADARAETDRPHGYGVYVLQGAFTLWNMQADEAVSISAELIGLSVGRPGAPVRGSGIFVSGAGDVGGRLRVKRLETEEVYSDGGIAPGTADQITGGVFTVYGTIVDVVRNHAAVETYGVNDMVLDNWGSVDRWIAEEKITSYGPSGIGFVNFGTVNLLEAKAPIETFGQGARGFNVYTGTVKRAEFDRVVTHADGAVGIQISQPIGQLTVHRGIETFGGTGPSLVKGVVVMLSAIPLSIKPGGSAREIRIAGGVVAHGKDVPAIEHHGSVETLIVSGGFVAAGEPDKAS
jgi:hypothetical protein